VLRTAARHPEISKLAVREPPYHVDSSAPKLPHDFAAQLDRLVKDGRRAEAVTRFMVEAAEIPADVVAAMRTQPGWSSLPSPDHGDRATPASAV
jgi:hypothetical protein